MNLPGNIAQAQGSTVAENLGANQSKAGAVGDHSVQVNENPSVRDFAADHAGVPGNDVQSRESAPAEETEAPAAEAEAPSAEGGSKSRFCENVKAAGSFCKGKLSEITGRAAQSIGNGCTKINKHANENVEEAKEACKELSDSICDATRPLRGFAANILETMGKLALSGLVDMFKALAFIVNFAIKALVFVVTFVASKINSFAMALQEEVKFVCEKMCKGFHSMKILMMHLFNIILARVHTFAGWVYDHTDPISVPLADEDEKAANVEKAEVVANVEKAEAIASVEGAKVVAGVVEAEKAADAVEALVAA
jgi:hypothetical protein